MGWKHRFKIETRLKKNYSSSCLNLKGKSIRNWRRKIGRVKYVFDIQLFIYEIINLFYNFHVSRMLQENPTLLQLYRDLVITHVITSEEFWAQHATQYTQAQKAPRQEIGVNSAFLVSTQNGHS